MKRVPQPEEQQKRNVSPKPATVKEKAKPQKVNWDNLITEFKTKMESRFINPVNYLLEHEANENFYPGYLTVVTDCLVLETIYQYIHGLADTTAEIHNHCAFVELLTTQEPFKNYVSVGIAHQFYKNVRNGLIHQLDPTDDSVITKTGIKPIIKRDGNLEVNRITFHQDVSNFFYNYIEQLKDEHNHQLRENFLLRMEIIEPYNQDDHRLTTCRYCHKRLYKY